MSHTPTQTASPEEVIAYFEEQGKYVVTFLGYSGSGYEEEEAVLDQIREILSEFDPENTIVNIGATEVGIGKAYRLAKEVGFPTTGIVSSQAQEYDEPLSPYVDQVFYVPDESWGGRIEGTDRLSPTSEAMVRCSDELVAIGGGAVARDELEAARRAGKKTRFYPADMDHQKAIEKARSKGLPDPTDFSGEAGK